MQDNNGNGQGRGSPHRKSRGGSSSFAMHSSEAVFTALALRPGQNFLDLGCGPGDYALEAARRVGDSGVAYGLDNWAHAVGVLQQEAKRRGLTNIRAVVCDITAPLPLGHGCIDVCLLATVLHIPAVASKAGVLCQEILRVLRPGGRLAVIECKKEDMPFGPPKEMRWSAQDVETVMLPQGYTPCGSVDLGYTYLIQFKKPA